MRWLRGVALVALCCAACGDDDGPSDAGRDAGDVGALDASETDAGEVDAGTDAGGDDAGTDAGSDADTDVGLDAGDTDAAMDAGTMCGAVVEVASVEELVALAPANWGRASFESQWLGSADIRATASFTVTGSDFATPGDCMAPACMANVNMRLRGAPSGVTRDGDIDVTSDALFRMRFNITFLAPVSDFPIVYFEKACATACGGDETRCEEDSSCYSTGRTFCLACDHDAPARCACVGDDGSDLPDGTGCTYIVGDIGIAGGCNGGICSSP